MSRLEEMLRIARAATRAKENDGNAWYYREIYPAFRDGFNPRTAEALVKVALAAMRPMHDGGWKRCRICRGENLGHSDFSGHKQDCALRALTAAMASEDGQSPAEGLSEAKPSEEDNSNVG